MDRDTRGTNDESTPPETAGIERRTILKGALASCWPSPAVRSRRRPRRSGCTSAKLEAGGKHGASDAKCAATASRKGEAIDGACLDRSTVKAIRSFRKAEAKGGCITIADAAFVEQIVDGVSTA